MNLVDSIEKAIKKIEALFNEQGVDKITIQRKYLPEIFSADLLEISKNDGIPALKPFVLDYFKKIGMIMAFSINEIQFKMDYFTKMQLATKINLLKLKDEQIKNLEDSLQNQAEKAKTLKD
ncbi:MAG: hypothetical protein ACFFB0_20120 [Promethearchaeota archaeon]